MPAMKNRVKYVLITPIDDKNYSNDMIPRDWVYSKKTYLNNHQAIFSYPKEKVFKEVEPQKEQLIMNENQHTVYIWTRYYFAYENIYESYAYADQDRSKGYSIHESMYGLLKEEILKISPAKFDLLENSSLLNSIVDKLVERLLISSESEKKHIVRVPYFAMRDYLKRFVFDPSEFIENTNKDFANLYKYINKTYGDYLKGESQ